MQRIKPNKTLRYNFTAEGFHIFYFLSSFLIFLLIYVSMPQFFYKLLTYLTADMVGLALNISGTDAIVYDNVIKTSGISVMISPECIPFISLSVYSAFIISYKSSLLDKIQGILLGISILISVNLFRLFITIAISTYSPNIFKVVHIYFGQILMSICVLMTCVAWCQMKYNVVFKDSIIYFLLKVGFIFSTLFVPWIYIQKYYMLFINTIVNFFFQLFNYNVGMTLKPTEIISSSFRIIFFSSLILATKSLNKKNKIKSLLIGVFLISLMQMIVNTCLIGNFFSPHYLWEVAYKIISSLLFVSPNLIWIISLVCAKQLFRSNRIKNPIFDWNNPKVGKRHVIQHQ